MLLGSAVQVTDGRQYQVARQKVLVSSSEKAQNRPRTGVLNPYGAGPWCSSTNRCVLQLARRLVVRVFDDGDHGFHHRLPAQTELDRYTVTTGTRFSPPTAQVDYGRHGLTPLMTLQAGGEAAWRWLYRAVDLHRMTLAAGGPA